MVWKLPVRIGVAVAAVLGSLALAVVLAPQIVDVEAYKPAMIAAVKEATGRDLVIEGPMKLSVFPRPRVSARKVRFGNAVGAKGAQMVDVAWVGVSPSWSALLQGKVEVGRLTLYRPTIILETDANGRPNWEFRPGAGAAQAPGAPSSGLHLAIGRLRIVQGTLAYTNPRTGQTLKAGQVDMTASVGSLEGPFALVGSATINGVPMSLDLRAGGPSAMGHDLAFKFKVQSGTLDFDGHVSRIAADADVSGKVSIASGALGDFVAAIGLATGQQVPALDAVAGPLAFDGSVDFKAGRLALTDFHLAVGGETASGSVALAIGGGASSLQGKLSLPRFDADKWATVLAGSGTSRPEKLPATALASLSSFPPEWAISLEIAAHEVLYRKGVVRDLALAIEIANGAISLPRLGAILPGDLTLNAHATSAGDAQLAGELSLAGSRLREMLAWLDVDTSGVPADRLQSVSATARIVSAATGILHGDVVVDLDGQHATGSGSVALGTPAKATVTVQVDRFDLDAYLPKPVTSPTPPGPPGPTTAPPVVATPVLPTVDKTAPVLGLKAKVAKLVWRGEALNGVDVDASIQNNLLKVNGARVGDLLGARLDLKGQVADLLTSPRFDVTFNASMPDTDKLLVYVGLPKFINGRIGASTASGAVAGTRESLSLRNASATVAGATMRATGSLVLGDKFAFDFPSLSLQADDASRLVSVATGRSQSGLGALAASGAFKGNERRAAFDGKLTAMGTQMTGRIEASLGERPNVVVNLRVPGTLDIDRWLGVAEAPAASAAPAGGARGPAAVTPGPARVSTDKAIDLSGLRAFDATLNLETSAIEVASLKVTYADMAATLRNGVFRISKLTGQFYGGAVDFAGTVDASRGALSVDMAGSLQGIYLGELLRGAAGHNVYGNEHLTVAVDGKISIFDISVSGRGSSPEQIRDSLIGRGRLSGILYPSVAGGSLGFATFATGLGSIFSTEMGFTSAALSGFINAQSTIEGELSVAGGVLTLSNHMVKGQNATALVNSRNSFVAATTDTTIALDTGRRGPADYVLTVRGPVSSPTWRTARGPN